MSEGKKQRLEALGEALHQLVEAVRRNHPELGDCVLYVFDGEGSGKIRGRFIADPGAMKVRVRCIRSGAETPEGLEPVIHLCPSAKASARSLGGTLVHELVHQLAWEREVASSAAGEDPARWTDTEDREGGSGFHTEVFAEVAREVGLSVTYDEKKGWARTRWSEVGLSRYGDLLPPLDAALSNLESGDLGAERTVFWAGLLRDGPPKFDYWEDFNKHLSGRRDLPLAIGIFLAAAVLVVGFVLVVQGGGW